jgi:hypothetical protein
VPGLLSHQADLLRNYMAVHSKHADIALQLPTGSGKTLVGLLIAEWRRRKYSERVVYLCPTRQLVNQVAEQATQKYGIDLHSFTGKRVYYDPKKAADWQNNEAVAVTTYSSLFNTNPFFSDPSVIILDDAHSAENYVAKYWSLRGHAGGACCRGGPLMPDSILSLDAFVRAIGAARLTSHALFLGAGASISSGMPSAQMCIWDWKRSIFLTNNIGLESQFSELTLASVQARIQRWLDRQGLYPEAGDSDEYSVFVESCYPIPDSRRAFFQEKVRHANPHIGYRIIGFLAKQGLIRSVWTTNFDQLASRAVVESQLTPVEVGIDSKHRIVRPASSGEVLIVSLHGDYRYDALKNTQQELQDQERELEQALVRELTNTPTIVCGYSGRERSDG